MTDENKKLMLIVEDEDDQREILVDEFEDQDFEVITASNGKDGVDTALEKKPDIILLDIVMPVMDGLEMMEAVRNSGVWGKKVPILLFTNLPGESDRVLSSVAKNEPSYYMVKANWDLPDVVEKVNQALSGRE